MSNALPIAKLAVQALTTISVSSVVRDVIRNNTVAVTVFDQVKVTVGSLVVGSIVNDYATKHVNEKMDAAIDWYESRKTA